MRIAWIGTGVMGSSMAGHLLDAGHDVTVFNRTKARADDVVARGAAWADSPAAAAAGAEAVFTIVGYPTDVRETVLADDGVLGAMDAGTLFVDMTTSEPTLAREIAEVAAGKDVLALDAPVSGGDVGARNAALVIMCGGTQEAFDRAKPLLDALGRVVTLQGPPGAGQHTKMVNQVAIASGMVALCEALLYGHRAGLDLERVLDTIGGGAAGSWSMANYGPRLLKGDLSPGFKVDHFIKDLGIALAEARRMGLALPGTALAEQLYVALSAQGDGERGTQALAAALARLNGGDWPPAS